MNRPVGRWTPTIAPDAGAELPVFLQIARAIARDVHSGRLPRGTRLPSSRQLAASLGVHRNTVLAAYRELMAEGFLATEAGRGTFIAEVLPEQRPRRPASTQGTAAPRRQAGFDFEPQSTPPPFQAPPRGAKVLYGGVPDLRLVPTTVLARAYRRALRAPSELLAYGDPLGEPRLRAALAEMLRASRGLRVEPGEILVTRGSQMALALIGRLLGGPGAHVAVEAMGYPPAWKVLAEGGARLVPIPVDRQGLVVERLAELCEETRVRGVYVTPHHQYPTTHTMSAPRRMRLLQLAREHRFAIIEDDYDHEFHYEGRPVLPLASMDDSGQVLYVGTLSKVLAPGLRMGYLVAPAPVREAALAQRYFLDRQGDHVSERAVAELLEEGELQRHLWRARRVYHARRDHAVAALRGAFGGELSFEVPPGGMSLWARAPRWLEVEAWHAEAARRGVFFQTGRHFSFEGRARRHLRIGYGALTEPEMSAAVLRLAAAWQSVKTARGG